VDVPEYVKAVCEALFLNAAAITLAFGQFLLWGYIRDAAIRPTDVR
jgi:hypothetical protein